MRKLILLLLLLTLPAHARYIRVLDKAILPERQAWNYHGQFWEWWPRQYVLILDGGETLMSEDGGLPEFIYFMVPVSADAWEMNKEGLDYFWIDGEDEE